MTDDQEEIERLTRENARLRGMLTRAGVAILPEIDLPSLAELDRLIARVLAAYPVLDAEEVSKQEVANRIRFCAFVFRTDKLNTERSTGFWTDHASDWLRTQGLPTQMGLRSFCVAAIASQINFSSLSDFPFGLSWGMNLGSAARPSNKWRESLNAKPRPENDENYLRPVEQRNMVRESIKL